MIPAITIPTIATATMDSIIPMPRLFFLGDCSGWDAVSNTSSVRVSVCEFEGGEDGFRVI